MPRDKKGYNRSSRVDSRGHKRAGKKKEEEEDETLFAGRSTDKYSDMVSVKDVKEAKQSVTALKREYAAGEPAKQKRVKKVTVEAGNIAGVMADNERLKSETRAEKREIAKIYREASAGMIIEKKEPVNSKKDSTSLVTSTEKADNYVLSLDTTFKVDKQGNPPKSVAGFWNKGKAGNFTTPKPAGRKAAAILKEYEKLGLVPVFKGTSNDLVIPSDFKSKDVKRADYVAESVDKIKALGLDKQEGISTFSTSGNQLQTRVNDKGEFEGFYYQRGTKADPLPQYAIPQKAFILDSDAIGNFQADFIRGVSGEEFECINSRGEKTSIDPLLAYKGFAGSVTDSRGYYRSGEAKKVIKEALGESALAYLPPSGKFTEDVAVSDQQIAIISEIYSIDVNIIVRAGELTVEFQKSMKDIPDPINPRLLFKSTDDYVRKPNTDDILKAAVRRLKIDPVNCQAILQALYRQNWINYPRSSVQKAEEEPIQIKGASNSEEARKIVKQFQGSVQEKQMLEIIIKTIEAYEQGRNYVTNGYWSLYSNNDFIAKQEEIVFTGDRLEYEADDIDIEIGERGKKVEYISDYVIRENLTTPALRFKVLEELRNAGIISIREGRYVTDRRGIYLYAVNEFYEKQGYTRSFDLKRELFAAKSVKEIDAIASRFTVMDDADAVKMREYLKTRVPQLMEIEDDLADLDSF